MLQDWRFALRSVAQRRGSTLAILVTLSLGIGANSAIFSAVDAVLLKPLPYPDADRLVAIYEARVADNDLANLVAPVRLEEWNSLTRSFDGIAGSYFENVTDTTGSPPERVAARRTSPRFFSVLGAPPALGRTFTAEEERFGGPAVVVISDAFWRNRFNGEASVVGRSLMLGGVSRTIVGVMPPWFRYPVTSTEVWMPAQLPERLLGMRQARFYTAVGRLRADVALEQARDDLNAIQNRLGKQYPETDDGWSANLVPLKEEQVSGVRRSLWLLFGAVLLVLVAACGNIACLLLAQATRREQEVAVRLAMGATRPVLVRQMLREGVILALGGSIGGLVLARWTIQALRSGAGNLPRVEDLQIDSRLVVFALVLVVVTTVLFATLPALQATRSDLARRLAHGARGQVGGRQRLQRILVAAQISLAVVLLVGAGLLIRSFSRLQQISPGFDSNDVLTFRMSASWSEPPDAVANRQFRVLQRVRTIPGVMSASINSVLPAGGDFPPSEFTIVGRETSTGLFTMTRAVSADYFETLRIPLMQGATCRDEPRTNAPRTVLVNRTFAERYFPGETPVGHHIVLGRPAEIVGVVGDARERGLSRAPEPIAYACGLMPYWPDPYFIVRIDPARGATVAAIREALRQTEPQRAVYEAAALNDILSESLAQPRFNTVLLALFAGMALMLAGVGLHGILAQFVTSRRREIGLRLALGAPRKRVLAQLVGHGAVVTGVGVAIGIVVSFTLARVMSNLMFDISARDPLTFVLVPLVLGAVAAAATIVPASRAVRVEPMEALRED
jgi:putative ABC transport system permease protein